jgi:broad specificity phosphatase PhoE
MTTFLLMRHAQPDFSGLERLNAAGWPVDIAPLASSGEQQVAERLSQILEFGPEVVIASPVTRALHTAALLLAELHIPLKVEFDLYDWLPDLRLQRLTVDELRRRQSEFNSLKGEWPAGETRLWETASSMQHRVLAVLRKYCGYSRVLAVFHQEPIQVLTGASEVGLSALVRLELPSPQPLR